jgi:site-specific recombinase XerC
LRLVGLVGPVEGHAAPAREHYEARAESGGPGPAREITRKVIVEGRERRKGTPSQANNFLKLMGGLFTWAIEAEYLKSNPAEGVKAVKTKTAGFRAWEEDDVEKFEWRWPLGTRERLALTVLLYTGQG